VYIYILHNNITHSKYYTIILLINIIISISPLNNSICLFNNPVILLESNNIIPYL